MNEKTVISKKAVQLEDVMIAYQQIKDVVIHTPLQKNEQLSEKYGCNIYFKREDLQAIRSFKLRGAYYKVASLSAEMLEAGVVCASAGNHAQGVAYACNKLNVHGKIYMPTTTPKQKIKAVKRFGKDHVEVILTGDTFDDSYHEAVRCAEEENRSFIDPFDDEKVIAGQGTVAIEIMNDCDQQVDYVFAGIGGGGLMSGLSTYIKSVSPETKMIGIEPAGAASMKESIKTEKITTIHNIDSFVDGCAVKTPGKKTYDICRELIDDIISVPEGKVCTSILDLYNEHAIVVEPAGALPVAALDFYKDEIKGKNVVCVISGGNNDIGRMQEIKERSLLYEGYLYYFIVNFPQRAGALKEFVSDVLGPGDDITQFEYTKKNNKENGPVFVGIEVQKRENYPGLIERMKKKGFTFMEVNKDPDLFNLLI